MRICASSVDSHRYSSIAIFIYFCERLYLKISILTRDLWWRKITNLIFSILKLFLATFICCIHVHTHMATKTISITEEAYGRLLAKKRSHESFSEIINRITNKVNLLDFAGILTEEEADTVAGQVGKARALSRKRLTKVQLQ